MYVRPNPPSRFDTLLVTVCDGDGAVHTCDVCHEDMHGHEPRVIGDFVHAHWCCADVPARVGWFGGVMCDMPAQQQVAGMFDADRIMRRLNIDRALVVNAVRRGLLRVRPVRVRGVGAALPLFVVVSPQRIEGDIETLRADVAVARIIASTEGR